MSKLKGLLLTEGMHGMISQVEGLAKGLEIDFIHEKIELNNFWKLFPPKFTPINSFVFKNKIEKNFDIIISCGRKSIIPSIYFKKKFKNKVMNIHIQDPKVSLNNFDYIIAPEHDGLIGKNVLVTKGAIHYITEDDLIKNQSYLKPKINKEKVVTMIVGGPNKYYDFNDNIIENIFLNVQNDFIDKGYQLIFIPSMRTPKNIIEKAVNFFNEKQIIIKNIDKKAYLSSMKLADHIIVTCDSTSMISEAAMTGKPIYVAQMPSIRKNDRFQNFYKLFKSLNIIRDLEKTIDNWNYTKLNETDRISKLIKDKFKNYDFS